MSRDHVVVGAAGCALVVAALLALAPSLLPAGLRSLVADLAGTAGVGGLALLAGFLGTVQWLLSSNTPTTPPMPVDDATDGPDDGAAVAGEEFDRRLAAAGRVGERTAEAEALVREDLRRLAVDVYQRAHRCDWETAARAVEDGSWTDDPTAAAFVGGADAPDIPLRVWFRDVLSEEGAFHNQTTRTVRAIYALGDDLPDDADVTPAETDGTDAASPAGGVPTDPTEVPD